MGPIVRMPGLGLWMILSQGLGFRVNVTRTPKVCKIMAFMADLTGLGLLLSIFSPQ